MTSKRHLAQLLKINKMLISIICSALNNEVREDLVIGIESRLILKKTIHLAVRKSCVIRLSEVLTVHFPEICSNEPESWKRKKGT